MSTKREEAIKKLAKEGYSCADVEEFFGELDDLREGGTMNMMGGAKYLRDYYNLERDYAKEVLFAWMENCE